jgi:hypothetical protein
MQRSDEQLAGTHVRCCSVFSFYSTTIIVVSTDRQTEQRRLDRLRPAYGGTTVNCTYHLMKLSWLCFRRPEIAVRNDISSRTMRKPDDAEISRWNRFGKLLTDNQLVTGNRLQFDNTHTAGPKALWQRYTDRPTPSKCDFYQFTNLKSC